MGSTKTKIRELQSKRDIYGLEKVFHDTDPKIRSKVVKAFVEIGDVKTIEPLTKALLDEDASVCREAALGLCSSLGSDDSKIYNRTWQKLSDIGRFNSKAIIPFIKEFMNNKSKHRANAVKAIGHIIDRKIGDTEYFEPTLNLLLAALSENEKNVRKNAVKALGWIAFYKIPGYSNILNPLMKLLEDDNHETRANAAGALGYFEDRTTLEPLIKMVDDDYPDVRARAASSLGKTNDEKALNPLIRLLDDNDSGVRESAAEAIRYFEDPKAAYPLIKVLSDENEKTRRAAASALIPILKNNPKSVEENDIKGVCRLILKDTEISNGDRCDALDILLKDLKPDDLSVIIGVLFETEYYTGSPAFHSVIQSALTRIGKPCVPAMIEAFNNRDNANDIRVRAIKVLGGIDDPDAREILKKAVHDENLNVQNVAVSALKKS